MSRSTSNVLWKTVTRMILIPALLIGFGGCTTPQQDKTELRLAVGPGQYTEKWTQLLNQFNENSKNYYIRTVCYDGHERTLQQLEAELREGTAPDILALPKDAISVQDSADDIYPYLQNEQGETIELLPFFSNTFPRESRPYRLPLAVWCDTRIFYQQSQPLGEFYPLQGINSVWHLRNLYDENYSYDAEPNSSYFVFAPMELEISIYSDGKHKDGVQEFIQYALAAEQQLLLAGYDRFPITKDAFDLLCEQALLGEISGSGGFKLIDSDIEKLKTLFDNLWILGKWMDG